MKVVLKSVITHNQSTFIEGRQSVDGVLIVNECINSLMKKKEACILCKLHLEKAYDRVN